MSVTFFIENPDFDQLELNVSNSNFRSIVNALGLEVHPEDSSGSIDPRLLMEKIRSAIPQMGIRLDVSERNFYSKGLDVGRIEGYLKILTDIANLAMKFERRIVFA